MMTRILAALLFAFTLAACGQSGPLYVPGDPSSVETTPTTVESEEVEENGEDEEG